MPATLFCVASFVALLESTQIPHRTESVCGEASFPTPLHHVRAGGLTVDPTPTSAAACLQACCNAGVSCEAWQWCTNSSNKNHVNTCLRGKPTTIRKSADLFVGGWRRVKPPPPSPPLPPPPPPHTPARPTEGQLAWLDLEIGVFFHYTMYTFVSEPNPLSVHEDCGQVFNPNLKVMPDPSTFFPTTNGTFVDQWFDTAKLFGANYAILVTKHCDGFVSWPTAAVFADGTPYGYSAKETNWRGGKGDLVREFVDSARAHGIAPGFYYNLQRPFYLSSAATQGTHPVSTDEFYSIMFTHLTELWGNYGGLAEIWFDTAQPFNDDPALEAEVAALAARLQPDALLMQGPSESTTVGRKGAGETATVYDPNWYECANSTACRQSRGGWGNFIPAEGAGCAVGDGPSRQWFWHPDHDLHAAQKTIAMFWDEYHQSVGLGSNMLMGLTADRRGLVPDNDVAKLAEFGRLVKACYGQAVANVSYPKGSMLLNSSGDSVTLSLGRTPVQIDRMWVREDVATGQRVTGFEVLTQSVNGGPFTLIFTGTSMARKRIVPFGRNVSAVAVRVTVRTAVAWPVPVHEVAAFAPCETPVGSLSG